MSSTAFHKTTLRVFIASSNEVKDERNECVQIINKLRNARPHLDIECVHWEYNMPHSNYPGHKDIQAAINESQLKDCAIVIFIFYSRIGKFTREEFEYAIKNNKRVFVYFKEGFTPQDMSSIETWTELVIFRNSLNETTLYERYTDTKDFERLLYINLNLFFGQTFAFAAIDGQSTEELTKRLEEQEKIRKELDKLLSLQKQNDSLKSLALEQVKKGNYKSAEKSLLQSAAESIQETASTFFQLGKIKELEFRYEDAYEYYKLSAKIAPQNHLYLEAAASAARQLGYYNECQNINEQILKELNKNEGVNVEVANLLNNLGVTLRFKGFPDKAIQYLNKSLKIKRQILKATDPSLAINYSNLGLAFRDKAEYDKAIKYYRKAVTIDKGAYGEIHQKVAHRYNNLGDIYSRIDKLDKALYYILKAIDIYEQIGTPAHEIANSFSNLASIYADKREFENASMYFKKALDVTINIYGEEHPDVAVYYNNYGTILRARGEIAGALKCFEKALSIGKRFLGEEHPDIATWLNNIALIYISEEKYDRAIENLTEALLIGKRFHGDKHPNNAMHLTNLGVCYEKKGDNPAALEYFQNALMTFNKIFPANHPNIVHTQSLLDTALNKKASS